MEAANPTTTALPIDRANEQPGAVQHYPCSIDCETCQRDDLARKVDRLTEAVAHLTTVVEGQAARVDGLLEQAGPALDELGRMAEAVQQGGIMALLKPKKAGK